LEKVAVRVECVKQINTKKKSLNGKRNLLAMLRAANISAAALSCLLARQPNMLAILFCHK